MLNRPYSPAAHRRPRAASFRALVAILALLAQAVVPFVHSWECSETAPSAFADATPRRPQLSTPSHDCDSCPICKAVREASRPSLDTSAPPQLVLTAGFFFAASAADPISHVPLAAAHARGPPVVL